MGVQGPELYREDLPANLAEYCDPTYRVFAMKEIPVTSKNVHKTANESEVILNDPLFSQSVQYGDDPPDFSELISVLPLSPRSKRKKRGCMTPDGDFISNCVWLQVSLTST